ncbi:MAG: DUF5615 family PIN-like protein [Planctomycetota bacterium]|nr:DUF5615 family PIN-like protein [Planctomycetota bacterium]
MRILLDTYVSGRVGEQIREHGCDVLWSGDMQSDPGDDELLALTLRERRILVTLDKDFGERAVLKRRSHRGVLRLVGSKPSDRERICRSALELYQTELSLGALVTVEPEEFGFGPTSVTVDGRDGPTRTCSAQSCGSRR